MANHVVRQTIFRGILPSGVVRPDHRKPLLEVESPSTKTLRYSILVQSYDDLKEPQNSPSTSMWDFLLVSAQTQRLNEISIYTEKGLTADAMRFLYMNDLALTIWEEMEKPIKVMGRLHRPPRGSTLSFGMPFSE